MTTTLIAFGDLHSGSTIGICPPVLELDDGGTYHASPGQRWLWARWQEAIEDVYKLPGEKVCIANGDICEIDSKARSHQVITRNKATIQKIAADTLAPMVDQAKSVYVIRGTAAHTGKSAWAEEAIANDLNAVKSAHSASWWHLRLSCEGVRFDIAHHASMSGSFMSEKNAPNRLAVDALYRYRVEMDAPAPHVLLRSHNHRYADSGGNYPLFAVSLPAWTLATEFIYRIGKENTTADIGLVAFICDRGKYEYRVFRYPLESKRLWTLKA